MMKVLIADDHQLFIDGLRSLLSTEPGIEITGHATNGEQVLRQLSLTPVDVLLLDINMPDTEVVDLTRQIREKFSSVKIVILTMYHGTRYYVKLLKYQINGYLYKNISREKLVGALNRVQEGEMAISQEVLLDTTPTRHDLLPTGTTDPANLLTNREQEVLQLIASQQSNRQIAEKLCLSTGTVDTHRKNILWKLGVKNTVGLIKYCLHHNLIDEYQEV